MNKAILALALISALALLVIGCTQTPLPTGTGTPTTGGETAKAATESSISGDLKDIDNLTNELNDSELNQTDSYLNEINW
jgi:hypothetical protein